MSLEDGEYELDLSGLLEPSDSESYALRYGFIPDSMDQSKPLRLYRDEKTYLLKAQSATDANKSIIFEGIPQKSRKNGGAMQDSYFISFDPQKNEKKVKLEKLDNSIRFTKSRNIQKLEQDIRNWDREFGSGSTGGPEQKEKMGESGSLPASSRSEGRNALKRPPVKPNAADISQESAIIGDSDFDDLDEDEEGEDQGISFPNNEMKKTAKSVGTNVKSSSSNANAGSADKNNGDERKTPAKDVEDDFKDLEDQLEELLENDDNGAQPTTFHQNRTQPNALSNMSDEEESDEDDNNFIGTPILINFDEGTSSDKKAAFKSYKNKNTKPTSLRALVGDTKENNNGSSSEEE